MSIKIVAVVGINEKLTIVSIKKSEMLKEYGAYVLLKSDVDTCQEFIDKVTELKELF